VGFAWPLVAFSYLGSTKVFVRFARARGLPGYLQQCTKHVSGLTAGCSRCDWPAAGLKTELYKVFLIARGRGKTLSVCPDSAVALSLDSDVMFLVLVGWCHCDNAGVCDGTSLFDLGTVTGRNGFLPDS